ncbi:MAG: GTP-binding protein [Puia sp.]|nr:GTP-binding protein [Puia sp.]
MKIHLLSGFLGSGKTTAIRQACGLLLAENIPVGVITNDQGIRLVDGDYFKSLGIPGLQVGNGCFCCNYRDLEERIESLIQTYDPACIFAEAVGSCTDMVATVVKPLRRFRPDTEVTLSVLADVRLLKMLLEENKRLFEASVNYIYFKQLEEAGIIVVNKIDLMRPSELEKLKLTLQERYGHKTILYQDNFQEDDVRRWLNALNEYRVPGGLSSLDIDYDLYGEGEAALGWLDEELRIESPDGRAEEAALAIAHTLFEKVVDAGHPIGHLKFMLNNRLKISYTAGDQMRSDPVIQPARSATLLINARVQVAPEVLMRLAEEARMAIQAAFKGRVHADSLSAFQPGYPRPAHRIGN